MIIIVLYHLKDLYSVLKTNPSLIHTFDGVVEEPSKKPPKKYLETLIVGFGKTDVLGFSCCYLLTFHVAIND